MRRPVSRLIAAAVVCLAVVAPWLLIPGGSSSAYAFHRFAAALVEAKTARFQMQVTIEGLPVQTAQAYYLAPGKVRQESPLGTVTISDDVNGRATTLVPLTKTAIVMTSQGRPPGAPSQDPFFRMRELLSRSRDAKDDQFRSIGEKEIDGKTAAGFLSDTAAGRFTLWGDPATGLPVRIEAVWSGTPKSEVVMSHFDINVAVDESLFNLTPPADYKVQSFEADLSPPAEADLVEAFRICGRLSGGEFPDSLNPIGMASFIGKHTAARFANPAEADMQKVMKEIAPIPRGFRFALELTDAADAHYAGKGVKQGDARKPIFWYRPQGSAKYRVLRADLTIEDAEAAPQVSGAERLKGAK